MRKQLILKNAKTLSENLKKKQGNGRVVMQWLSDLDFKANRQQYLTALSNTIPRINVEI